MRKHKLVLAGVTLLAASLAMSACGSRAQQAPGGEAGAAKVAKIGVIAPLSGDLSALGLGIKNSVDLAIKQANEKKTIPGWTLELDAQDDQATPDVGKNAATKLAGDDEVIGSSARSTPRSRSRCSRFSRGPISLRCRRRTPTRR